MKNQKSILGFFQKSSPSAPSAAANVEPSSSPTQRASEQRGASKTNDAPKDKKEKKDGARFTQDLTPAPSSDLGASEDGDPTDTKASLLGLGMGRRVGSPAEFPVS